MANVKITDLTAYTNPASTDVLPIVDVVADVTKKVAIGDLLKNASSGTAAAPGIAFDGDSNTGVYRPGADQVAVSTNGTERIRIDSSGKLGIGTSSPSSTLHVRGTSATTNGGATILVDSSASLAADIGGSIAFRATNGTDARTYGLIRGGKTNAGVGFDGYLALETRSNGQTNTTERLRITNTGNVGIGTTSPAQKLTVSTGVDTDAGNIEIGLGSVTAGATRQAVITKNTTSPFELTLKSSSGGTPAPVIFQISSTQEAARIDSSGRLLVGTATARSNVDVDNSLFAPQVQIEGTGGATSSLSIIRNSTGGADNCPRLFLARARNAGVGGNDVVMPADSLGELLFNGADGTNLVEAASIKAQVDGTPGANDMPGRLVFSTTADGASSPTERMRIKSDGTINFSNVSVYADNAAAKAGGLVDGDVYRTSTGDLKIVYT